MESTIMNEAWEENFIPHIRYSRQTPMGTVRCRLIVIPLTHMCITSKRRQGCYIQNCYRNFHFLYHLQYTVWKYMVFPSIRFCHGILGNIAQPMRLITDAKQNNINSKDLRRMEIKSHLNLMWIGRGHMQKQEIHSAKRFNE